MHKLIIEDDEGRSTVVPLIRDEMTIGRKEGNTIRLTERNVSRQHARILKQNGEVFVEDLASYTGVRVNGTRISSPTPLRNGDQVHIGDYRLFIRAEVDADARGPTAPSLPAVGIPTPVTAQAAATQPIAVGSIAPLGVAAAQTVSAAAASTSAAPAFAATSAPMGAAPMVVPTPATAVPVHTRIDAQPTMPLRTLADQGIVPIAAGPPARLVVLTTDSAGKEFVLDRPSLVIGRTDENDIVCSDPSISRHHAKILRDGDRYTIVDLQSANGIRISGRTSERVDLQPGDIIDLGHVRMRFVGPYDTWVYNPLEFGRRSRVGLKIGAAVGGLALAGIVVFAVSAARRAQREEIAATTAPAAPSPPPAPAGPTPEQLLADATEAASAESWDKASSLLRQLFERPAATVGADVRARATELKEQVDAQQKAAATFAGFQKAIDAGEPDEALARYDELSEDSPYRARATTQIDNVRRMFVASHLAAAETARSEGRCDDARTEAARVLEIDGQNRKARTLARNCRPTPTATATETGAAAAADLTATRPGRSAAAIAARTGAGAGNLGSGGAERSAPAAPTGTRPPGVARANLARPVSPTRPAAATSVEPPASAADTDSAPDAAELIKDAREAWMKQQCASAIDLSRRALKAKPSASEAHQIIAACACSMRDRDGALRSYARLDERSRTMVRSLCAKNGVDLEP